MKHPARWMRSLLKSLKNKTDNMKNSPYAGCAIVLLLIVAACHRPSPDGFVLTGTLKGFSAGGAKLAVANDSDRTEKVVDSVAFTDGKFILKGKAPISRMMTLTIEPGAWSLPVFVENGSISVQADTVGSSYYDWTAYHGSKGAVIKHYQVSGSVSHADWLAYQDDPGLKRYDTTIDRFASGIESAKNKDDEYAARDNVDSVYKLKYRLQKDWISQYITKHPASGVGLYLFHDYYLFNGTIPPQDMEAVLTKFSDSVHAEPTYLYLRNMLDRRKALEPGNPAPDFTLLRKDSTTFTLSSTRGHYQMIDFWASWCYPCRKAIPHWKEVYDRYHAKGFDIVSVTDDNNWKLWFTAMDKEKMPWTQVADEFPYPMRPARVGELYMSQYIPFYVLLDPQGKIVLYNPTEAEMDKKLAEIFDRRL